MTDDEKAVVTELLDAWYADELRIIGEWGVNMVQDQRDLDAEAAQWATRLGIEWRP